jgi:16S rRNA (cytosine1402-N4)-methyltransferase
VEVLDPRRDEAYFDGTAGYGGHAAAILEKIGSGGRAILVDRDQKAVRFLRARFGSQVEILRRDFATAAEELADDGNLVNIALLDLGVSSPQLDEAERGFSFNLEAPLDMRMDNSQNLTAADVVNSYREQELADLLYAYGQEHRSRRIARAIVRSRPITTTKQLADVVTGSVGSTGKIHPATRTFQALRIEVNDELEQLKAALPQLERLLAPGGRLAVISFHSLEDRIVKEYIHTQSRDCICPPNQPTCTCNHLATLQKINRRVIKGSEYDAFNPRARSAKLRAAVKIKTKRERQP